MTPTPAVSPRRPNTAEFFTCQHPEDYHPDWAGFYEQAAARRPEVQTSYPHATGLIYGDNPYQIANVYYPEITHSPAPWILYFHGGRWREGHPDYYDTLAPAWVDRGAVFASLGYRLEPTYTVADAVDDVVTAIRWAIANAERFGADPNRLILAGHSAGAHIIEVAALTDWASDPALLAHVHGIIGMSGPLGPGDPDSADDTALFPALHLSRTPERVLLSYGVPEPNKKDTPDDLLTEAGRQLAAALRGFGAAPEVVEMPDTDHVLTGTLFGDPDSALFAASADVVFSRPELAP